jgi:hypothetical protein
VSTVTRDGKCQLFITQISVGSTPVRGPLTAYSHGSSHVKTYRCVGTDSNLMLNNKYIIGGNFTFQGQAVDTCDYVFVIKFNSTCLCY